MVVLHALGQCLIRTAVTTITPRADVCFALASYLTRERGNRVPRRLLESLFWPGIHPSDASHCLSEILRKLRHNGVPIQRDDGACVWLPREAVSVDIDHLPDEPLAAIADRDLTVLPGYQPAGSPAFSDWLDDWRDQLQIRLLHEVVSATNRAIRAGDWPIAVALAEKALRLDAEDGNAQAAHAVAIRGLAHAAAGHEAARAGSPPSRVHEGARRAPRAVPSPPVHSVYAAPLFGRDAELRTLLELGRQSAEGAVKCAFISGPTGMGKSRIAVEVVTRAAASGAATCTTRCAFRDSDRPLSAFIHAVPILQGLPGAAGCSPATLDCLSRVTSPAEAPQSPLSYRVTPVPLESIRAAVIDLVEAVAEEQPLVMLVEDVQWIDAASWDLLREIAAAAPGALLLICTSRVRWNHKGWGEPRAFVTLELKALPAPDARAHFLHCARFADRTPEHTFVEWCVDTARGNPYYLQELASFWALTGETYTAPPSLIALTDTRLACLRRQSLHVLQAAAVLAKNSTVDLLESLLAVPTYSLLASIEELSESGLIGAAGAAIVPGAAPVICRHDLVAQAALRSLSPHGLALLHGSAARVLEARVPAATSTELMWDCADHWRAAGQSDRFVSSAVSCARHLHEMGMLEAAIERCNSILDACCNDADRANVLRARATSEFSSREWATFCSTVESVRSLEGAGSLPRVFHDDLELRELAAQRGLHRDWNNILARTLQCVDATGASASHRFHAGIYALKLASNLGHAETMDQVYRTLQQLSSSASVGDVERLTSDLVYHAVRGDCAASVRAARALVSVARTTLPLRHQLPLLLDSVSPLRRGGAAGEAEAICTEIFRAAAPLGCSDLAAGAVAQLVEMYIDFDRCVEAENALTEYQQLSRLNARMPFRINVSIAAARLLVCRERWEAARRLLSPEGTSPLWTDEVDMARSSALATMLRVSCGSGAARDLVATKVAALASVNQRLWTTGAQDYECYSLYLGMRYIGDTDLAIAYLRKYVFQIRRDQRPFTNEILAECARLDLRL
ncbi:MAG: AAA family ATPase [Gemmatimonadota bacterium]|nr:AAA family ATPase [Gemmatimonadota bacterium]